MLKIRNQALPYQNVAMDSLHMGSFDTVCTKQPITAASQQSVWIFFPKNKMNYFNPPQNLLLLLFKSDICCHIPNFSLESSNLEFLKCVNFSYCTQTATALPNQLDLSVTCQVALAICLQSTARRYINSHR